ncbi:hypothetical protein ACTQ49_11730 [Luteococcus sp. Sow4_B9]|uniref:hypothetical protein n=1 Tax=Luteococcus sp. Sow4_B9 TaxID=3438792 RepID=UPI003F9E4E25
MSNAPNTITKYPGISDPYTRRRIAEAEMRAERERGYDAAALARRVDALDLPKPAPKPTPPKPTPTKPEDRPQAPTNSGGSQVPTPGVGGAQNRIHAPGIQRSGPARRATAPAPDGDQLTPDDLHALARYLEGQNAATRPAGRRLRF